MKVLLNTDTEDMILATVRAKMAQLKCVAPTGVYGSWMNELIKDINSAFDKVADKSTSNNAGCL